MMRWQDCKKILGISHGVSSGVVSEPVGAQTADLELTAITHDGRLATVSHVFMPLKRSQGSIRHFIHQALDTGCKAIIVDTAMAHGLENISKDILMIVPDFYQALAQIYPLFYPTLPQILVAITGTDGKTSTSMFLHQLWTLTQMPNATIGTMGAFSNPSMVNPIAGPAGMTTPPQPYLYALLSQYKTHGIDHVVFEASSHALAQYRLDPLRVNIAIFTSFAQDHLDYHSNLYAYWQAKWRLFTHALTENAPAYALIHNSIPLSLSDRELLSKTVSIIRYGQENQAIVGTENATFKILKSTSGGQYVAFAWRDHVWKSFIPLIGVFQISNVLAAVCAFVCAGGNIADVTTVLPLLKPILGRMEHVKTYNGAHIYVDYAHTPQGLLLALQALRSCTSGALGVVFGCGGERDALKRPLMGQVAAKHSDWVIVTDDNPRTEDPLDVRQHILVGCPGAESIGPRPAALRHAMEKLKPGDALLIAGKGHETTQTIGTHILHHSDQQWVREYDVS